VEAARVVRQIFDGVGQARLTRGEVGRRRRRAGVQTRTGKPGWDRGTGWGRRKNPAYGGMAGFGKTRVGPLRPRLHAQRGRPRQPRRADTP
jgi:site-specific DNA recombinase